ncbi:MAG TPA: hypothetical protein VLG11_05560 [Candidatus Saccharimonadales bacterium]|nr:hypothetical protein [Candidatus Saccharimonadales bacterium]
MEEYQHTNDDRDWSTLHHRPGVRRALRKVAAVGIMAGGIGFAAFQTVQASYDYSLAEHAAEQHQTVEAEAIHKLVLEEALLGGIVLGATALVGVKLMREN